MVASILRERARHAADLLAIAAALALPWSTSITSVLIALLAVALLLSLDPATIRETPMTLAGLLPVILWLLAAVGMMWADVAWAERLNGMRALHKLLLLPLLLAHFSRSGRGWMVAVAFLVSCSVILPLSFLFKSWPALAWHWSASPGVPVRDRIAQSGEFVLCALGLLALALQFWSRRQRLFAAGLFAFSGLFLLNVFYVVNSRTSLVVGPVLAVILGLRQLRWKGALLAASMAVVVGAGAWLSSPYLRERVLHLDREIDLYQTEADKIPGGVTSAGERLEFWQKSIGFIESAPLIGHGTGSTEALFRQSSVGQTGLAAIPATNPHNQTLAVGIELGAVGMAVLWAMWLSHLLLLRGPGLANTIGIFVVVQNIVSSLFNSHLWDFTQGWTYVLGVGVFGGMALRVRWNLDPPADRTAR